MMDMLRAATTNVWRLAETSSGHLLRYASPRLASRHDCTTTLKNDGVLCLQESDAILVFELQDNGDLTEQRVEEFGLVLESKHSLKALLDEDDTGSVIHSLGDAIAALVTPKLYQEHDLIPCGRMGWLHLQADDTDHATMFLGMHIKMSATGELFLAITTQMLPIAPLCGLDETHKSVVYMLPSATKARLAPDTRASSVPDSWRNAAQSALRRAGIHIASDSSWLPLLIDADHTLVWWPQTLCVCSQEGRVDTPMPSLVDDITLSPSDHQEPSDLLAFAEQWLQSADDRKDELELAVKDSQMQVDSPSDERFDIATAASPPYTHRPDLVNALSVYPTPPDGVVIATQSRMSVAADTPSIIAIAQDNDVAARLYQTTTHDDDDTMLDSRPRGPSIASSTGGQYRHNISDLFGEPDTEIRDAEVVDDGDFDFFDEQDDAVMQDTTSSVPTEDLAQSTEVPLSTPSPALDDAGPVTTSSAAAETVTVDIPVLQGVIYKPLSPFDIRERLLPPPVPASISMQSNDRAQVRSNKYGPLTFNQQDRRRSFALLSGVSSPLTRSQNTSPNDTRQGMQRPDSSSSSEGDPALRLLQLPWQSHKRKRTSDIVSDRYTSWDIISRSGTTGMDHYTVTNRLSRLLDIKSGLPELPTDSIRVDTREFWSIAEALQLDPADITEFAQICCEQAVTCLDCIVTPSVTRFTTTSQTALITGLTRVISDAVAPLTACDISSLALIKDTSRAALPLKGQPRVPRVEVTQAPDVQFSPVPHMRVRRAGTALEVLPSALHFWEELSLAPFTARKDIVLFCVGPADIRHNVAFTAFLEALKAAYEGCKLGSVDTGDLLASGKVDSTHFQAFENSIQDSLQSCHAACLATSQAITSLASANVVVLMVDHLLTPSDRASLSACFLTLNKTQLTSRSSGGSRVSKSVSLQLLPLSIFAEDRMLDLLSSQEAATFAREVYDRCPASSPDSKLSPLPIIHEAATMIAAALPRRINLQLTSAPPTDLMHENSELHVAYSRSSDQDWLTVCWVDSTGAAQHTSAFSLKDTDFSTVAAEIVRRTVSILRSRDVSWRLTIVTDSPISEVESRHWHTAVVDEALTKRVLTVTLVSFEREPIISLYSSEIMDGSSTGNASGAGFLTPVTTPQGTSFPFSPENAQVNPSTPAPTAEVSADNDVETNIVDLADETWRVLLKPEMELSVAAIKKDDATISASGILVKHGENSHGPPHKLPTSAVNVIWLLRVRPDPRTIEEGTSKQAEMMLREILSGYRNLALLAKVRGLSRSGEECMPLHLLCTSRGAKALEGLL